MTKKIVHIVGARPNFIKLAPLWHALSTYKDIQQIIIHTGQHYDPSMSAIFFRDLGLPAPDINLGVNRGNYLEQIATMIESLKDIFTKKRPDLVIVYGDVNSTLAGTLAASKLSCRIAHVEAGLRSNNTQMPEERNRIIVDHLVDYLFSPSSDGAANLIKEKISRGAIYTVGNIMIDSLYYARQLVNNSKPTPFIKKLIPYKNKFALLTIHRSGNVDDLQHFRELITIMDQVSSHIPIIFPIHPRTLSMIKRLKSGRFQDFKGTLDRPGIYIVPPVSYKDFIALYGLTLFVMTDSGGVQEETSVLGIPCLTLREDTERPLTVSKGTNTLVGFSRNKIIRHVKSIMTGHYKRGEAISGWDGKTGPRIAEIINSILR